MKFDQLRLLSALLGLFFVCTQPSWAVSGKKALDVQKKSVVARKIDLAQVTQMLQSTGLVGFIHGSVKEREMYVLTYRNPGDFFDHMEFPLIVEDEALKPVLAKTKRHQKVKIHGEIVENKAPLSHILVHQIELLEDFSSATDQYPFVPKTKIDELLTQKNLTARVHAIDSGGQVLVLEYKDLIVPMFVKAEADLAITRKLYRGDKISVEYDVRSYPENQVHLSPHAMENQQTAMKVLESLVLFHGQKISRQGYLVRFPKSPQISTDTFAVLYEDAEGSAIQYTLVNFENPEVFKQIREKLNAAWNTEMEKIENGRNKLVHRGVRIKVNGTGNVVDPGQANPQILIDNISQIQILKD